MKPTIIVEKTQAEVDDLAKAIETGNLDRAQSLLGPLQRSNAVLLRFSKCRSAALPGLGSIGFARAGDGAAGCPALCAEVSTQLNGRFFVRQRLDVHLSPTRSGIGAGGVRSPSCRTPACAAAFFWRCAPRGAQRRARLPCPAGRPVLGNID